jgi:formylmethanofuran dehydrogenase subunit E-like metal-binding protein
VKLRSTPGRRRIFRFAAPTSFHRNHNLSGTTVCTESRDHNEIVTVTQFRYLADFGRHATQASSIITVPMQILRKDTTVVEPVAVPADVVD